MIANSDSREASAVTPVMTHSGPDTAVSNPLKNLAEESEIHPVGRFGKKHLPNADKLWLLNFVSMMLLIKPLIYVVG